MPRINLRTYLAVLAALAVSLAITGYRSGDGSPAAVALRPASGAQTLPDMSGTWVGTWEDTRYLVSGGLTCTINAAGGVWAATGRIDLTALGLGWQTGTAAGSVGGDVLTFSFTSTGVGLGEGTLDGTAGAGTGTVTPPLDYQGFTFSGSATSAEISGTFAFDAPTGGWGDVILHPGVPDETASWSDVKARFR